MLRTLTAFCLATMLAACGPTADEDANVETQAEPSRVENVDEFRAQSVDLGPRDQMPGAALYAESCGSCHNGTVPKAPHITFLEMLSPAAILKSMNEGIMMAQAEGLSDEQRRQVAEYITQTPAGAEMAPAYAMQCPDGTQLDTGKGIRKVGWGARHPSLF